MKHNNKSKHFKDWTTDKLKTEAKGYHEAIYITECYGTRDMRMLDGILAELEKRGLRAIQALSFQDDIDDL